MEFEFEFGNKLRIPIRMTVELGCSILERKTAFNWKTNIPRGFLKKCYDDLGWSFYVK